MSRLQKSLGRVLTVTAVAAAVTLGVPAAAPAQDFDFEQLEKKIRAYTVMVDIKIEVSFGMHTSEQVERLLGTIVSEDGLVMFHGASLGSDAAFSSMAGLMIKTTPTRIDISTLDGHKYEGRFVGVDRFTKIGFVRISGVEEPFTPVKFRSGRVFKTGSWLALYMLLPEFVSPPLAADVGMLSSIVESPEYFPLTVGFNALQMNSVLYDENLEPVGALGTLLDPSAATADPSGLLESFQQFGMPLLGVITGERLNKIIADPPQKGEIDRGWLGISLQALTPEMSEFWSLNVPGGIIINDIVANSPAAKAGLIVGDIIFEVNGQPVEVDKEEEISIFQRLIAEMGPGVSVEVLLLRPGDQTTDTLTKVVTLEKAPLAATEAAEYEIESLEVKVRNLVFADYMFYQLDPDQFAGVAVSELKPGGLADIGGLELGDIIQRINNLEISSVDDVESLLEQLHDEQPQEVIFFVWRDNKTLFVNVKTDWR